MSTKHDICKELYDIVQSLLTILTGNHIPYDKSELYIGNHPAHGRFVIIPESIQACLSIFIGDSRYRIISHLQSIEKVKDNSLEWVWLYADKFDTKIDYITELMNIFIHLLNMMTIYCTIKHVVGDPVSDADQYMCS